MNETQAERWRRKGLDPKYGPRWYLHRDGRPPEEDDRDYIWNASSQRWEAELDDIDEEALETWEEQRRQRIAERNEY